MDWIIITTFFCFISLVLNVLLVTQVKSLQDRFQSILDGTFCSSNALKTIISQLTQIEQKQDTMFGNAPPKYTLDPCEEYEETPEEYAKRKLKEHQIKLPLVMVKKKGRPKKAHKRKSKSTNESQIDIQAASGAGVGS